MLKSESKRVQLDLGCATRKDLRLVIHFSEAKASMVEVWSRSSEGAWIKIADMAAEDLLRSYVALQAESYEWDSRICADHGLYKGDYSTMCPTCLADKEREEKARAVEESLSPVALVS